MGADLRLKAPTSSATMLQLMAGAAPKALRSGAAELPTPLKLVDSPSESELQEVIAATYQQLIDRIPCEAAGSRSPVALWHDRRRRFRC